MAVTFIVEDGTGKSDATSYSDLAFAEQYVEDYITDSTDWDGATNDVKEQALNIASRYLDVQYGLILQGYRYLDTQALDWPRSYVVDRDGYSIDTDEIPVRWKQATVEVAVYVVSNGEVFSELDSEGKLQAEEITIDVITIKKQWAGTNTSSAVKSKVYGLVSEYLKSGSGGLSAEVRRG